MSHDSAVQPQVETVLESDAPARTPSPQGHAATVTLHIPGSLREFSGAEAQIPFAAASVRELLALIARERPALYAGICDETGRVRKHMNIFVNGKHMRDREGLETPLAPGDAVYAWPAVSGG